MVRSEPLSTHSHPCHTNVLFHYFLGGHFEESLRSILAQGLRPLSDFPDSDRWRLIDRQYPEIFEQLYQLFAAPVLGHSYSNSGIYLTPIDFRLVPSSNMARRQRLRIPVDRIKPSKACLTWELDGLRESLPFEQDSLRRAARIWSSDLVVSWFGRDPERLFYYVPQVVTYQGRIDVTEHDVE